MNVRQSMVGRASWLGSVVAAVIVFSAGSIAQAANLDVLWYTGGGGTNGAFAALAAGNNWNVTYWDSGAMPAGSYNALVVGSTISFGTSYTDLTNASFTLGDRVMVTGQDADYHYLYGPGPGPFDGPRGFLTDAVNWAGSGTGMGAVLMVTSPDAMVAAGQLTGLPTSYPDNVNFYNSFYSNEDVIIPVAYAAYPINAGLTSGGLSNWGNSNHEAWAQSAVDLTKWTPINVDGDLLDGSGNPYAVTLVSAATAGGGTSVPEPCTLIVWSLLGACGAGLGVWRKRKAA